MPSQHETTNHNDATMQRTYKMLASRAGQIVFDDRITADSPRDARDQMKKLLGLPSLSGVVYSITEIPVELIREIVDGRLAELAGGEAPKAPVPADVERLLTERLQPILNRLAALERQPAPEPEQPARFDPLAELADAPPVPGEPDWALVKRHFRRYGDPAKTAAKYGLNVRELNARARKEGWAA